MKQHILNIVLVLVIAIGGIYLMQPQTVYAQQETCKVGPDEDACTECYGADCQEGDVKECGMLQSGETMVLCAEKDGGSTVPIEN